MIQRSIDKFLIWLWRKVIRGVGDPPAPIQRAFDREASWILRVQIKVWTDIQDRMSQMLLQIRDELMDVFESMAQDLQETTGELGEFDDE